MTESTERADGHDISFDEDESVPLYDNVLYCPSQMPDEVTENDAYGVQQWTSSTYVSATPAESHANSVHESDDVHPAFPADGDTTNDCTAEAQQQQASEDGGDRDAAAGSPQNGGQTEELDISTPPYTQNNVTNSTERFDTASRLVRQYMGADVPARTTSNTRTGLKALCTFVCDLENKPYMVNRNDQVEPPTGVFKEGRKILSSFNSMGNSSGYYPSGFDNWTEFEHRRVRHYLREFIIHYKKKMEAS